MGMKIKSEYIVTKICMGILILFMLSIGVRLCTRQILVKKMKLENAFTHFIFWDNSKMATVDLEEKGRAINVDWKTLYPFGQEEVSGNAVIENAFHIPYMYKYIHMINAFEVKVEGYATDILAGKEILTRWHEIYNNLIGWKDFRSDIIYMRNGYLTYVELQISDEDIKEMADSVWDFKYFLEGQGIPLYYINAGSKVNPVDRQMEEQQVRAEFSNENGDALLKALSERNIHVLDMREAMLADGLDWYESYYKTDHHWKTETGLWAAGVVARMLHEKEGFGLNPRFFHEDSYEMTTYADCMFGGQGRAVTFANAEAEAYTCILPKFDTDFSIEIPTRGLNISGTYKDALYDYGNLERVLQYSEEDYLNEKDAYNSVAWRNDAMGIVKNNHTGNNADKKILILQDSFCWYSTTYLACDMGEIHMIYPADFDGSIHTYVKDIKPDVVIIMYCERNINAIDWNSHKSMFDFR